MVTRQTRETGSLGLVRPLKFFPRLQTRFLQTYLVTTRPRREYSCAPVAQRYLKLNRLDTGTAGVPPATVRQTLLALSNH